MDYGGFNHTTIMQHSYNIHTTFIQQSYNIIHQSHNIHTTIVQQSYNNHTTFYFCCAIVRFQADVISYTTVIGGLGKAGEWRKALKLFDVMPSAGVEPNGYTYGAAIAACAQVNTTRSQRRLLIVL